MGRLSTKPVCRDISGSVSAVMANCVFAAIVLSLVAVLACSGKHEVSQDERRHAEHNEVVSFANANGASVPPDIKDGFTLDWQRALRGPHKLFAFRGSVSDIFEKDSNYFLKVVDDDDKLLWMIQCSEAEADGVRGPSANVLDILFVVEATEVQPVRTEDFTVEVTGTLRKFQPSTLP